MKIFALAAATLLSFSAFAGQVEFAIAPEAPFVIQSDLQLPLGIVIKRPWIKTSFQVSNNTAETITVIGIIMDVDSDVDVTQTYNFSFNPVEIAPGAAADLGTDYAAQLPASQSTVYNVEAQLSGWVGTANDMKSRLNVHKTFKTQ